MFKKIEEAVKNYGVIAEDMHKKHMDVIQKINSDFIGERLQIETAKEDKRYLVDLGAIRINFANIINKACDNLALYVRRIMSEINANSLSEIKALRDTGLNFSLDDLKVFLDRYSAKGDYWSLRAMIALCNQQGYEDIHDFNLADNLALIEKVRTDALFYINTFETSDAGMTDSAVYVALQRIKAELGVAIYDYVRAFNSNPVCTTLRYENEVKADLLKRYEKFYEKNDSDGIKMLEREIRENLWDGYIAGIENEELEKLFQVDDIDKQWENYMNYVRHGVIVNQ